MTVSISCEFFPVQTAEGMQKLLNTAHLLRHIKPTLFSVTFGAGGSSQARTLDTVQQLNLLQHAPIAPHLTCVGATEQSVLSLLEHYQREGYTHLVALRGDLPDATNSAGHFEYASDLITFVRKQTGDHFNIYAAAYPEVHPQATSPQADFEALLTKFRSGANAAITQYFFNPDAYFDLVDRLNKEGVTQPVIAGIMPITNYTQLARFSAACGTEIPRWMRLRLESYGDDLASIRAFGQECIIRLCERLIAGGVQQLHFYTLNQATSTLAITEALSCQ